MVDLKNLSRLSPLASRKAALTDSGIVALWTLLPVPDGANVTTVWVVKAVLTAALIGVQVLAIASESPVEAQLDFAKEQQATLLKLQAIKTIIGNQQAPASDKITPITPPEQPA